jgi:hypothetical protein
LKTNPDVTGSDRNAQHFVQVAEGDGGVEIGLAGGDAFGSHLVQEFCGGCQDAVKTLLMHGGGYSGLSLRRNARFPAKFTFTAT